MSESIITASELHKDFATKTAVDGLDLNIQRSECYGLLGPNGAGKTTTLRMLYGVTLPTSGRIEIFGLDIRHHRREIRRRLGVALQDNVLVEPLSAEENLAIFGRYHLMSGDKLRSRVEAMIDFLDLASHRGMPVRNLSGGYQRRLAIAQALINDPELVILDEPTTGLDPAVRLALWTRIRDLGDRGRTVVLTTHYMDEAERLCDRVGIVSNGRLIAEGTPRELIDNTLDREALEIECTEHDEAVLMTGREKPRHSIRSGKRLVLYYEDAAPVAAHVRSDPDTSAKVIAVRPTNLEDVFLALTGTRMELDE